MTNKLPEEVQKVVDEWWGEVKKIQGENKIFAPRVQKDQVEMLVASCLASENNEGWRKYPEEKPEDIGYYATMMGEEPEMGTRMDVCFFMSKDIPGQTDGWGTPLMHAWANNEVIRFHALPVPYTEHKEEKV